MATVATSRCEKAARRRAWLRLTFTANAGFVSRDVMVHPAFSTAHRQRSPPGVACAGAAKTTLKPKAGAGSIQDEIEGGALFLAWRGDRLAVGVVAGARVFLRREHGVHDRG